MAKKVIDITSNKDKPDVIPQLTPKKVVRIEGSKKEKKIRKQRQPLKLPSFNILYGVLGVVIVLAIIVIVLSFQSKLTLKVSPVFKEVKLTEEVKVSISQTSLDFTGKVIPGQLFSTEEEKWNTFKSTGSGEEGGKAKGTITIYNSHTPARFVTLVAQTRFLSAEKGKTFRIKEKVVIPPATNQGGKLVPSSVEVEVEAQESGESYNIPASTFSVPGLSGSALYYSVWAESDSPIKGGFESETKIVTKDDLDLAKESIRKELEEISSQSLKSVVPDGFLIGTDAVLFEDFQSSCFQEEGATAIEFNCYGKVKAVGLGFRRADLREISKKFIALKINTEEKLSNNSLNYSFSSLGSITKAGSVILDLKVTGDVYREINEDVLIFDVLGKNKDSIQSVITENYPQIKSISMKFWPFWMRKAPKNEDKVSLELILK